MILTENKNDIILRDYQQEAVSFLNSNNGKLILAMCPSSGKTETIIYYLNEQFKINPNIRVLILPHSTNVLLDNFYQRLELRNVDFTYSSDINDDVNIHVILPQNHNRIVGYYDLIIIDEAHENYLAKTIQGIIKKTQVQKEILLTGTPSKFIGNNDFKLHFVALSDLCELYTPKLRIDVIESDYDWNGNYNQIKELKNSFKFTKESTEISLKKIFDFLLKKNNSIQKTLIVCRNIAQSNYVKNYLTSIGFSSEISNSDNDKDSENVSKFKNNFIDILIVVNRARLGYDDADLINLIDISGTLNPNIIYQMFARLLRGTKDIKKYYIRLSSKNDDIYNSEIATSVALMLTHTNYIQVFNGKNFNSQEIIVNSDFFLKSKNKLDNSNSKSNLSKRKLFIDVQDELDVINFFKKVIEEKEKNVGLYKFCKVSEVINELNVKKGQSRTKEECIENARKYSSAKEWEKNDLRILNYARIKGWYHDCSSHFVRKSSSRTKQECIKNARQYKTIKEWYKKDTNIYSYATRKGWLNECTAEMLIFKKTRTKEECIENARKYSSSIEWIENDKNVYGYALKKGWLKECSGHFFIKSTSRTKQECIENAHKYKTRKEWKEKDKNIYSYAAMKGWLNECTAEMLILKKSRTKEECIENARKYNSQKEWKEKDKNIYSYAAMKGWLKECSGHFIILNGKSRTKEECIENARKYNSQKEWNDNDSTIYGYACSKGWLKECSGHFNTRKKIRTLEECIQISKKYKTTKEWIENDKNIYVYAQRKGWLKECSKHKTI